MEQQRKEEHISVQQWFKDNISTMAVIVMSIAYIIYGLVTIKESGKTVIEIVAGGVISFFMGFTIKSLFNAQGVTNGEKSDKFVGTKLNYVDILEEIEPYQQYLSKFCEMKNENDLKVAQKSILKSVRIDYDKFIKNEIDYKKLNKKQKKAYNRATNIKIHYINDAILLSDFELSFDAGKDLSINKKKYLRQSNSKTFLIMIFTAFLFGYFSIDISSGFNYKGMIWSTIQVAYYLGFGSLQYYNGYSFMTDTYRTTLCEKTRLLKDFRNMYTKNPSKFTEEEVKEEISVNDGFKKLKKGIKSIQEQDLITNAKKDKNAVETKLEPINNEINDININVDNTNKNVEEHIKTFEELCNEHKNIIS